MKRRTLLVDCDILAYKAAAACENVYYFNGGEEEPCVAENLEEALEVADRDLDAIANKLKATDIVICLTDDDNFRNGVYPEYKSNRANVRRPATLQAVKDHYAAKHRTYQRPGLEADDCMGILATHKTQLPGEKIIVSEDKDMQTIPGLLYNPRKDRKPRRITKLAADLFFLEQTLTGDPTDGYPGCPRIGPKSPFVAAVRTSESVSEAWGHVVAGYASKGLTEADAIVQARCARILRATDWDWKKRAPRLWSPPV